MFNSQYDCLEYENLALPYDRQLSKLADYPRITRGENMMATSGGDLIRRPGTIAVSGAPILAERIDRLEIYETLETPAKVYLLASLYDHPSYPGAWSLWYIRLGTSGWIDLGNLRGIQDSTRPHEIVISRGLAFIKAFPGANSNEVLNGDALGTAIFDGSGASPITTIWGISAPETPARLAGVVHTLSGAINSSQLTLTLSGTTGLPGSYPYVLSIGEEDVIVVSSAGGSTFNITRGANGTPAVAHPNGAEVLYKDWAASTQAVTVNFGWRYSYAYKTLTGHISSRAALETNPDLRPSDTGGFANLIPKIEFEGHASTTHVPEIVIFRTTDGGSVFYELETIPNPGTGTFTYSDDSWASASGSVDPLPDELLTDNNVAPTLTSHSPPPTVLAPLVTGVDTPAASSPMVFFAGRIWYAIGNVLFFSGNEEITTGIPEEAWPSETKNGHFFRLQHPVVSLKTTSETLYIWTTQDTYTIRGSTINSFQINKIFAGIGMPENQGHACAVVGNAVVWVSHDFRVVSAVGDQLNIISDPLSNDIVARMSPDVNITVVPFSELDKNFVFVHMFNKNTVSDFVLVYDITLSENKPFWHTPWVMHNTTIMASGRIQESSQRRHVLVFHWNGTNGQLATLDSDLVSNPTDATTTGPTTYEAFAEFNLVRNPPGNHVNSMRLSALHTVLVGIIIDRMTFFGDSEPTVSIYTDDLWTNAITPSEEFPPRRGMGAGYITHWYMVNRVAQRIGLKIVKPASTEHFRLARIAFVFNPEGGA